MQIDSKTTATVDPKTAAEQRRLRRRERNRRNWRHEELRLRERHNAISAMIFSRQIAERIMNAPPKKDPPERRRFPVRKMKTRSIFAPMICSVCNESIPVKKFYTAQKIDGLYFEIYCGPCSLEIPVPT